MRSIEKEGRAKSKPAELRLISPVFTDIVPDIIAMVPRDAETHTHLPSDRLSRASLNDYFGVVALNGKLQELKTRINADPREPNIVQSDHIVESRRSNSIDLRSWSVSEKIGEWTRTITVASSHQALQNLLRIDLKHTGTENHLKIFYGDYTDQKVVRIERLLEEKWPYTTYHYGNLKSWDKGYWVHFIDQTRNSGRRAVYAECKDDASVETPLWKGHIQGWDESRRRIEFGARTT